jgi:hypothetical protein
MMDSQEFGSRISWILQGIINCVIFNTACKLTQIPRHYIKMSKVTSRNKVLAFITLLPAQKIAYDSNLRILLYTNNVME